jgi:SAM-dependent methyltransferase
VSVGQRVQADVLEALESAHNWNAWLADVTQPYLGDDPVEIGSGIGTNAQLWLDRGVRRVAVSERDAGGVAELRRRFAGDARVRVEQLDVRQAPERNFSACVALNVLEHIQDDVAALRGAARLLQAGGAVVMFVPAFGFASGRFDRIIGHHRRYTRTSLSRAYAAAGLSMENIRYVNAPGLVAWAVMVRLLRQVPHEGRMLAAWDRSVIPIARRLEETWSPPFGQSVLAVGRVA